MASGLDFPTFYDRFEYLRSRLRRSLGWQTLTVLAICTLLGIAMIAGLDYRFELPWIVRAVSLVLACAAGLMLSVGTLLSGLRRWTQGRTASAIERRFPELGQRVRTTVEYRGHSVDELKSLGVAPGLMRALETEAAVSTLPLPLENLIPTKQLIAMTATAAAMFGFLSSAVMWSGDWQTALRRALLADEPFTELSDTTSQSSVERGSGLTLQAIVRGRPRDSVILRTRIAGRQNKPWTEQLLSLKDGAATALDEWSYSVVVPSVEDPFDYQWVAGPEQSPQRHIDVRYPLQIASVSVEITPPDYTALPPTQNADGNLTVLEGSSGRFVVELDGVPASALVTFSPPTTNGNEDTGPEAIAPRIEGTKLTFEKTFTHDVNWKVEAQSFHDIPLADNSYRIRVRKDQPPTVYFEEPAELLDVHALAEILMRIRARDDFGLVRAGIVFQINNDEEHTLFAEDYVNSGDQSPSTRNGSPKTATALERILPLEHFKLIQKDSITYYGFAEDNRPGQMQRTETELRFIDIRPFQIRYQLPSPSQNEPDDPQNQRPQRATFEELIGRQREALNRTLSMKRARKPELGGLDRLMKFEAEIADKTNELARYLKSEAEKSRVPELAENADLLFQAERAMLDSVDSISVGKFEIAMLQEKDAVRFLIESRDRLTVFLQNPTTPSDLRDAMNAFFRLQQTKLRLKRSPSLDQQTKLDDLLAQLAQLANQQGLIAAQLNVMNAGGAGGNMPPAEASEPNVGNSSAPDAKGSQGQPSSNGDANSAGVSETATSRTNGVSSATTPPDEIVNQQLEIARVSAMIQKELDQMPQMTELARRRMAAATEATESAEHELARGISRGAAAAASIAAERLDDIVELAQGLFAQELADQLDLAREMADEISRREIDLANGGGSNPPVKTDQQEAAARRSERIASAGESLVDILTSSTRSTLKSDQKAVPRITELLEKDGVGKAVERIQQQPAGIRGGRIDEVKKAAIEIADTLEKAARTLDALRREIVDPKVAELMKLETRAQELADGLDDAETRRQSEQWLRAAGDFLDRMKEIGLESTAADEMKQEMKNDGWDEKANTVHRAGEDVLQGNRYKKSLGAIAIELREVVKQLLLSEMMVSGDETPPAQYEAMVTRFQRVLTLGGENHQSKKKQTRQRRSQ